MNTAPDPGKGQFKNYNEPPMELSGEELNAKIRTLYQEMQLQPPVPEPVPLRWPDIPVSDDAWFQQPEPDRDVDVAAWVLSAVMAVVLLLTGFIIGWSWGG